MIINIKVLPDGRGKIHWFIRGEGPIENPIRVDQTEIGPITLGGAKGWIACNPQQNTVLPQQIGMEHYLCLHSDEPRAVTCPDCIKTEEFKNHMAMINQIGK